MSQKLTIAVYLKGRGEVKSLTRIEAEAFGIPYPLVSGWPARYGNVEITKVMLADLMARVARASRSTANKARRGLTGIDNRLQIAQSEVVLAQLGSSQEQSLAPIHAVHGFVLRRPRRNYVRRKEALRG
jgi:hypothetical protein